MKIPKYVTPEYDLTLPLSGHVIKYRPFLVKEQKILLVALESGDENDTIEAMKQIVSNCIIKSEKPIDVGKLPLFDVEFIFFKIRSSAVGDRVELTYKCKNKIDTDDGTFKECGNIVPVALRLDEVKFKIPDPKSKTITFSDTPLLGVEMEYPTYDILATLHEKGDLKRLFKFATDCIVSIFDSENVYLKKDIPKEEMDSFLDTLPQDQFDKIVEFLNGIPKLEHDLEFNCKKCKHHELIHLSGLQDFFG